MTKIAIKVTALAYYDGGLVYPGTIIENYEGEIPKWATLAGGKEQNTETPPEHPQPPEDGSSNAGQAGQDGDGDEEETQINAPEAETEKQSEQKEEKIPDGDDVHIIPQEKTEAQIMEELDNLITKAIEKKIVIEDADKKTVDEQIAELKARLGEE